MQDLIQPTVETNRGPGAEVPVNMPKVRVKAPVIKVKKKEDLRDSDQTQEHPEAFA